MKDKTSKLDIQKKTNALNSIAKELQSVEDLRSSISSRLDILFSSDCTECYRQAGFIKTTREIFQANRLQGLITALDDFTKSLQPNEYFPHHEDISNDNN